jgi:hypothetical protein
MKKIIPFLLAAALTACGQSETPQKANTSEANIPTVEELASNPERFKELRQQCKTDRPKLATCCATGWPKPRASDSMATAKRPTRRRKNRRSSDRWRLAASPSFSSSTRRNAPSLAAFFFGCRCIHSVFLLDLSA